MSTRFPPNIDTDPSDVATPASQAGPIASPPSSTTQSDIRDILQREQDHAMSLLSLSPLLAGLFISYANRAATLEPAVATPPLDSEEWKVLRDILATLLEENDGLRSEVHGMVWKLETAKAPRDQVSSLRHANAAQRDDIELMRTELVEVEDKYDRHMEDSNTEKATLQIQVLDLEAQRGDLRETIVEQQMKISGLERRCFNSPYNLSTAVTYNQLDMTGERKQAERATREWVIENVRRPDDGWAPLVAGGEARERDEAADIWALSPMSPLFNPTNFSRGGGEF